ncbi:hypothetical protein [Streptomyces sp. NPDC001222]|uniref:hypothetical protein n=1 Tax=Streptomyces sp. NPDC001222 TaxID=3364548 RepID=UPI00368773EA
MSPEPGRLRAASGPSEGGQRQPLTTNNDHEGAADCRALVVCPSSYIQVSSHIRERQESIGMAVPV